jgi:hypothetical protein
MKRWPYDFDKVSDDLRREEQRQLAICHAAEVRRTTLQQTGTGVYLIGGHATQFTKAVQRLISWDPSNKTRLPHRHVQMYNLARFDFHLQNRMADEFSLILRRPTEVRGGFGDSDVFQRLRKDNNWDMPRVKGLKLKLSIGSVVMRPRIVKREDGSGRYFPVGVAAIEPHRVIMIPYPNNPTRPMVTIEFKTYANRYDLGPCEVVDLSIPDRPMWSAWKSLSSWVENRDRVDNPRTAVYDFMYQGDEFAWFYGGEPIMPYVPSSVQWSDGDLLSTNTGLVDSTVQIEIERTQARRMRWLLGRPRTYILANGKPAGLQEMDNGIDSVNVLWNEKPSAEGGKQDRPVISTADSATPDVVAHEESIFQMIDEYVSQFNPAAGATRTESKESSSGVALTIREGALWRFRDQQVMTSAPADEDLFRVAVASHNWLVSSGAIDDELCPEENPDAKGGTISLYYPVSWSPEQRRQAMAEMRAKVAAGYGSEVDLWLLEHELEDTEENRQQGLISVTKMQMERNALVKMGVGVPDAILFASPILSSLPSITLPTETPATVDENQSLDDEHEEVGDVPDDKDQGAG